MLNCTYQRMSRVQRTRERSFVAHLLHTSNLREYATAYTREKESWCTYDRMSCVLRMRECILSHIYCTPVVSKNELCHTNG